VTLLTTPEGTRRLVWIQLAIGAFTVIFCAVAAFVIYPSLHKAKQAEIKQTATANRAETNLALVASSTLQRVQLLDGQSRALTGGESPELYLWKGGLHKSAISPDVARDLSALINERRFLLGDSGPLLNYSVPLHTYVCEHFSFVIAESPGNAEATQKELMALRKRDPRFATAETFASGPTNPNNDGIAIGFFISHNDALALAREIGVSAAEVKQWGSCTI